jgi:hypothetical protein
MEAEKYLKCDLITIEEVKVMFTRISGLVEVRYANPESCHIAWSDSPC